MKDATTGNKTKSQELIPPFPSLDLLSNVSLQLTQSSQQRVVAKKLISLGLAPVVNTQLFAYILGVSPKLLQAMARFPDRYYRTFKIKKKSGGERQISTPRVFLKVVQKWILLNVLYKRALPDCIVGFVPGRSLIMNGKAHAGCKFLVHIDIENFFPSVKRKQVQDVYRE